MLEIFKYEENEVRTVVIENEPWFVAKDVANVLGYSNPQKAVRDHCKCAKPIGMNDSFTLDRQTTIIPERDIYRLIMRSKLSAAEKFEEWVVSEVLPSIRKTGKYNIADKKPRELVLAESMLIANDIINEQRLLIEDLTPKADIYDEFMKADTTISIKEFAEVTFDTLGLGEKKMFNELRSGKYICTNNLPYQKYINQGIFKVREIIYNYNNQNVIYSQTRITPKGQEYLLIKLRG